jgi:hypothetical protein
VYVSNFGNGALPRAACSPPQAASVKASEATTDTRMEDII